MPLQEMASASSQFRLDHVLPCGHRKEKCRRGRAGRGARPQDQAERPVPRTRPSLSEVSPRHASCLLPVHGTWLLRWLCLPGCPKVPPARGALASGPRCGEGRSTPGARLSGAGGHTLHCHALHCLAWGTCAHGKAQPPGVNAGWH